MSIADWKTRLRKLGVIRSRARRSAGYANTSSVRTIVIRKGGQDTDGDPDRGLTHRRSKGTAAKIASGDL